MNVPDKPGLYWAKMKGAGKQLYLMMVKGDPPFMEVYAFNVTGERASSSSRVFPYKADSWQWLGPANAPGQEEASTPPSAHVEVMT